MSTKRFLIKAATGKVNVQENTPFINIHKRFFAALMLNDLVHEEAFQGIMRKYDVARGNLQTVKFWLMNSKPNSVILIYYYEHHCP